MVVDDRLGRMENKLDKLAEAVTSLARMEERMLTLFKHMEKQDTLIESLVGRVDDMERVYIRRNVVDSVLDRIFWLAMGGGVAYVVRIMVI